MRNPNESLLTMSSYIEQVETLLKTQDPVATSPDIQATSFTREQGDVNAGGLRPVPAGDFNVIDPSLANVNGSSAERWAFSGNSPQPPMDTLGFNGDLNMGMGIDDHTFTWEMIGLGLEEPLPLQETIDDL